MRLLLYGAIVLATLNLALNPVSHQPFGLVLNLAVVLISVGLLVYTRDDR